MGCYSQSCVVSRLEIGDGDKCGVIPILKNNGGSINDSIFHMYKPFCFPIFGRYNDYGGLKDIVEDDNTAAICKYYDIKITKIYILENNIRIYQTVILFILEEEIM